MRKLTDYQKHFLLENFFKNEKYAGWRSIAMKLLETGQCIVAGKECIWVGGIGNFIKTEIAKDAVDCTLYKFDIEYFFNSEWYKEVRNARASILMNKKRELEQECEEISNI
jgi:hypothetical protein